MIKRLHIELPSKDVFDILVACHQNTIIRDIQKQISEQHSLARLPTDKMRLLYNDIALKSSDRVIDCDIREDATIKLIPLFDEVNMIAKQEYVYSDYIEHISVENGKKYDVHHTPLITIKSEKNGFKIYNDDMAECIRTLAYREPENSDVEGNKYVYLLQLNGHATQSKMDVVANTPIASTNKYVEHLQPKEILKKYLKFGEPVECHVMAESTEIEPELPMEVYVDIDEIDEDNVIQQQPVTYPDREFSSSVKVVPLLPLREHTKYCLLLCRGCPLVPVDMMEASFLSFSDAKCITYDYLVIFET